MRCRGVFDSLLNDCDDDVAGVDTVRQQLNAFDDAGKYELLS